MKQLQRVIVLAVWLGLLAGSPVVAHEMTVQGTVAAIEAQRIQVRTGKEKAGVEPAWYPIDSRTRISRGKTAVTLEAARIQLKERVVVIVDHPDKGPMVTKEIRLAAR